MKFFLTIIHILRVVVVQFGLLSPTSCHCWHGQEVRSTRCDTLHASTNQLVETNCMLGVGLVAHMSTCLLNGSVDNAKRGMTNCWWSATVL